MEDKQVDRIIFGDNQFFGINHMSEERAQARAERFKDIGAIIDVIDNAYACGIHAFMFNTHDRVGELCDHFRAHPGRYRDLRLYPSMPYAHKYANAVNEKGMVGALNEFVLSGCSTGQVVSTLIRGGRTVIHRDMLEVMKLLVDLEMRMFRGLKVRAVFLQNIVTDLLLGFNAKEVFLEFCKHIKTSYHVEPAFITTNMPRLVSFLLENGIENPIVSAGINKTGFAMCPNQEQCERTLAEKSFRPRAMSVFYSGTIPPREAIEYVCGLPNIQSIVFGASSRQHIEHTREMIRSRWDLGAFLARPAAVS